MVDDLPVILFFDTVQFKCFRLIHQIKQCRKCVAKTDAAAATMANIENPFQFTVQEFLVIEIGVFPIDWMSGRCLEAAFRIAVIVVSHGYFFVLTSIPKGMLGNSLMTSDCTGAVVGISRRPYRSIRTRGRVGTSRHNPGEKQKTGHTDRVSPFHPGLSGNDWHGSALPWPASQTNRLQKALDVWSVPRGCLQNSCYCG